MPKRKEQLSGLTDMQEPASKQPKPEDILKPLEDQLVKNQHGLINMG
jgi:hypothetical protein